MTRPTSADAADERGPDRDRATPFDSTRRGRCATAAPRAALDRLIEHLDAAGEYRALLDALLLKARHELGLPLIAPGSLADLPEPARTQYEEKYVEAIRLVGSQYLEAGDIPTAWAYFRAIAETEPVARAIRDLPARRRDDASGWARSSRSPSTTASTRARVRADPGALRHLPGDLGLRAIAAARRGDARRLRRAADPPPAPELTANLRAEIASRGQLLPPEGTSIAELIAGRDWLFADESYHIDISHLAAVVRMSLLGA